MNRTKIEWVKNPDGTQGYTWNPITGCLNGCEYCYARKLANGRLKSRYLANGNYAPMTVADIDNPFYPRFWLERLEQPMNRAYARGRGTTLYGHKPRGIFCCDMSDLFGIGISEDWTQQVMDVIRADSEDRFYLLTKQPQNLAKWNPYPPNCWVGASATDWLSLSHALGHLGNVSATVTFISLEPLLRYETAIANAIYNERHKIGWLIIGAQTPYSPKTAPRIEWVREIVEAANTAGIKVFLKNNLAPGLKGTKGWTSAWAVSARGCDGTEYLRQEFPK